MQQETARNRKLDTENRILRSKILRKGHRKPYKQNLVLLRYNRLLLRSVSADR